jgi:hypothetical protein
LDGFTFTVKKNIQNHDTKGIQFGFFRLSTRMKKEREKHFSAKKTKDVDFQSIFQYNRAQMLFIPEREISTPQVFLWNVVQIKVSVVLINSNLY